MNCSASPLPRLHALFLPVYDLTHDQACWSNSDFMSDCLAFYSLLPSEVHRVFCCWFKHKNIKSLMWCFIHQHWDM